MIIMQIQQYLLYVCLCFLFLYRYHRIWQPESIIMTSSRFIATVLAWVVIGLITDNIEGKRKLCHLHKRSGKCLDVKLRKRGGAESFRKGLCTERGGRCELFISETAASCDCIRRDTILWNFMNDSHLKEDPSCESRPNLYN